MRSWMKVAVAFAIVCLVRPPWASAADKPKAEVKIVTLGDSITRGVRQGVKPEATFAFLLQEALKKEGVAAEVVNVGIGGEDTTRALARLERAVIALKPQIVTIMYGTNDSWIDRGKKDSRLTPERYRANLVKLIEDLRKAGIRPILMTEPCLGTKHGPNGAGEHPNKRLEDFMVLCRAVATETKTPLIDHFAHWSRAQTAGTDLTAWTTDQCHPSARGHREMAATMLPIILKAIREKK